MRTLQPVIVALIVAAAIVFGSMRVLRADQPQGGGAVPGRYQFQLGPAASYLTDTTTGDTWMRTGDGKWTHLGNPTQHRQPGMVK